MVNWIEVNELKKRKVRFGWFDFIDDLEVSKALLGEVVRFGKQHQLELERPKLCNKVPSLSLSR